MINDILFCLLGYTGGVFTDNITSFGINETISCISHSEKEILKKIGIIGFKYKILKDFVKNYNDLFNQKLMKSSYLYNDNKYSDEEINEESNLTTSIYLSPISFSIEDFLKEYERDIQDLEVKYYNHLNLTGSDIIAKLDHYTIKFDKIYIFLQHVCNNTPQGRGIAELPLRKYNQWGSTNQKNI
jgi:hypothetical protein